MTMSARIHSRWKRRLWRLLIKTPLCKMRDCGNYHPIWHRFCYCRINTWCVGWQGGVQDLRTGAELSFQWTENGVRVGAPKKKLEQIALPTWDRARALLASGEYELVKAKDLAEFNQRPPVKAPVWRRVIYLVTGR